MNSKLIRKTESTVDSPGRIFSIAYKILHPIIPNNIIPSICPFTPGMVKQPISATWSHNSAGRITLISLDTGGIFSCVARLVCSDISARCRRYGNEHGFIWSLHQRQIQREMENGKERGPDRSRVKFRQIYSQLSILFHILAKVANFMISFLDPFSSIHPMLYAYIHRKDW